MKRYLPIVAVLLSLMVVPLICRAADVRLEFWGQVNDPGLVQPGQVEGTMVPATIPAGQAILGGSDGVVVWNMPSTLFDEIYWMQKFWTEPPVWTPTGPNLILDDVWIQRPSSLGGWDYATNPQWASSLYADYPFITPLTDITLWYGPAPWDAGTRIGLQTTADGSYWQPVTETVAVPEPSTWGLLLLGLVIVLLMPRWRSAVPASRG